MKNKLLILFVLLLSLPGFSQKKITWEDLSKVVFVQKFFTEYNQDFLYPKFSESVLALEGKKVTISGFFLDVDPNGRVLVLSKNPLSSCFFCGESGPETAIEMQCAKKPNFKTDDLITVTGVLKLNKDDVEHFNYILTDCSVKSAL